MQAYSRGFTAPSTPFPGAYISFECVHWYDGDVYIRGDWITNVFASDGDWVKHEGADNVQDNMEAFILMLTPFYDGVASWTDDETGEEISFWEMTLRTLRWNLGPVPDTNDAC